jgi:hypothetical protein
MVVLGRGGVGIVPGHDYYASFVDEESRALGLTRDDLRCWEPPVTPARGRAAGRRTTRTAERR